MKKQDKHPIDHLFKENTEQHFPYDPALWSEADKGIAALFGRKYLYILSAIFLLFISTFAVFFAFDTNSKPEKVSMSKHSKTTFSENSKTSNKSNSYTSTSIKNSTIITTENPTTENNPGSENPAKTNVSKSTYQSQINEGDHSETHPDKKPLASKKPENTITDKPEKEIEIKSDKRDIAIVKEADPIIVETVEKQKTDYYNFILLSKPFPAFAFNAMGKGPEINKLNLDRKERKFATTIEFENLNSVFLTHKLSGLSQNELAYRSKYEKVQNSTGYSLNIMLQRGGFGLVTGLGYTSAAIKTSYIATNNMFELGDTKYKMLDDSVRKTNGGTQWSNIREYRDTIARHSEEGPMKGQAPQNIFQWIQVPLKISYQLPLYRFRLSARVGVDFMWRYNTTGSFINSGLNGLNTEEKFNNFNVNASGQIMAGYQLNHKIQVGLSIYMNQQLGSNFANYDSRFQSKGFGWYVRWGL